MFTIKEASTIIGVSESTIKNWIKTGLLHSENNLINKDELFKLKNDIENGRINKLKKRANKSKLNKIFIPEEYIEKNQLYNENIIRIKNIVDYINKNRLEIEKSIDYLLFNYIKSFNLLEKKSILKEIKIDITDKKYSPLIDFKLPESFDPVGLIYQSIFKEGDKSKKGSYYTPTSIIEEIKDEYINGNLRVCDPCCGTGQFLLIFSDIIKNPVNLYGFDIDRIAVKICRVNLLLKYKEIDFEPNIFCLNTLIEGRDLKNFDIIATNPPWGGHFKKEELNILKERYPYIKSKESFSYFLVKSLELLKDGGTLSFILPESILNVDIHKEIREIISQYNIKQIKHYGRIFKNVFSNVIRMDIVKEKKNNNKNVFNIYIKDRDIEIFNKIFELNHTTLKNRAKWALGIVTGNNSKYLVKEKLSDFEPIYTGKEVKPFFLDRPTYYIKWMPDRFQQVAKEEYYRSNEKLVYKFISKNLVFAYDNSKSLTLNSANILIPDSHYSIKVILALFNSSLYHFIFRKKFNSIKVLRSHLENLPLPFLSQDIVKNIESMVDHIIKNRIFDFSQLDDYIFWCFNLENERDYIKKIAKE